MEILLTLIWWIIWYFLKFYLDKKQESTKILQEYKRKQYEEFTSFMIDLIKSTKLWKSKVDEKTISKLYDIYKKFILFADSKVINTFWDFMQYLYLNPDNIDTTITFKYYSKMFLEMRKDIWLWNDSLWIDWEKILRPLFKDYNKLF
jgi:hypothetical protein